LIKQGETMKTMLVALGLLGAVACAPVGVAVREPGFDLAVGDFGPPPAYYGPAYGPPVAYVPPAVVVERPVYVGPRFVRPRYDYRGGGHFDRGRRWERPRSWHGHRD
jgi:hypothetical protein